ncbi:MAG: 4-hydroxy-3-methylbut-2-en-1-yl diphosphate synthase [Spirochaetales bacterium]|jgi:2-dehydro-3-deoxyglucarate aldolase/4-hydroxy-2-oxoheptanedioate aldolase|nr:4-hydroxy-3-methylbut-2-en-1-yl diphosphate synthase [Spirochaetales bacterium]
MKTYGSEWKQKLKAGEFILGGHIFLPNPAMAEALACFGYKYIWIDAEHGAFDKDAILAHIVALNGAGAGAFVRVTSGDPAVIKPLLEMGPDGIIIPNVCSAEEARRGVAACTYPPKGIRGFGPRRASRYGLISDKEYLDSVDGCLVKIMQIEHRDAVAHIDDILGVEGIDAIIIGPNDLSGSLGLLTQIRHPDVLAQCEKVIRSCKAHGIPCGLSIGPDNADYIKRWLDLDVNFLFCGDDIAFTKMGAEAVMSQIKKNRSG